MNVFAEIAMESYGVDSASLARAIGSLAAAIERDTRDNAYDCVEAAMAEMGLAPCGGNK